MKRIHSAVIAVILLLSALGWGVTAGHAAADPGHVTLRATIAGSEFTGSGSRNPVILHPGQTVNVVVQINNSTARPVEVTQIDLRGGVLGMDFFIYSTTADVTVPASTTREATYPLKMVGLEHQATGLVGADVIARGADDQVVGRTGGVVDVRGSIFSVYGLFGLAILILSVLACIDTATRIAHHRLASNRWTRGLQFMLPGLGLGLVVVFVGSLARLLVPSSNTWAISLAACGAAAFALGYLMPAPSDGDLLDDDFPDDDADMPGASTPDDDIGAPRAAHDRAREALVPTQDGAR